MDWQVWSEFFRQNWLIILIALIILFLVINLVKTVIRWLIVIVIILAVFIYSGISLDQIKQTVTSVTDQTVGAVRDQALNVMKDEAKDARFIQNADGTYTIKSDNIELNGKPGAGKVSVTFRGVPLGEWDVNDTIQSVITQAKQNTAAGGSGS
ncbi:ATPase [Paenibacillus hunanensis]|uniref:ATPase n=1 Tax=Paenibacillus hunanensis TaxID=539262 RepID=UPI002A6AB873|nr:ATPase [Paenibacillus hunanensis]WPP42315.1 ATPase [Paenibacillus hunanensis]